MTLEALGAKMKGLMNGEPSSGGLFSFVRTGDTDDNNELGNPIVSAVYTFLVNPRSSKFAFCWALLVSWMVILRIIAIGFESCDGPNQYDGREDRARFGFFLTEEQYWKVEIACFAPILVDAFVRVILLCYVIFGEENTGILEVLEDDKMEIFLFFGDISGCIPFLIKAAYIRPQDVNLDRMGDLAYTIVELLITVRLLRVIRDFPSVRAIQRALNRAAPHLVLPLFFFVVFNITAGVFLYFVEPCYNTDTCPWIDLFQSSFFSIVTMTTSK